MKEIIITKESSVKQILAFFDQLAKTQEGGEWDDAEGIFNELISYKTIKTKYGQAKIVFSEDFNNGVPAQVVFNFLGRYFQFQYLYESWDGSAIDLRTFSEVEPKEKTIIVYQKIKKQKNKNNNNTVK